MNKIILLILIALNLTLELFAANIYNSKTTKRSDHKRQRAQELLGKKFLNQEDLNKLLSICLKTPDSCKDLKAIRPLPANEIMKGGFSFSHSLFLQYAPPAKTKHSMKRQIASGFLFFELMEWPDLDPHSSKEIDYYESAFDDLALDILRSSDITLIKQLLRNKNFDPNTLYHYYNFPLVTMLLCEHKFEEAHMVAKHPAFNSEISDDKNCRPAYYLLKQYKAYPSPELFKLLMPDNINKWPFDDLELSDHFSYLFQDILTNDDDRKAFLTKIIHEVYTLSDHKERDKILNHVEHYCNIHSWARELVEIHKKNSSIEA